MLFQFKSIEPVILITDLALSIEAFAFGLLLLFYWYKYRDKRKVTSIFWVAGFDSLALFALFGALSHGTNLQALGDALWPPTMIFGGIAFIFFLTGVIVYEKLPNYNTLLLIPIVLVITYFIINFILNWHFLLWVVLLIVCSVFIYISTFRAKKSQKIAAKYII